MFRMLLKCTNDEFCVHQSNLSPTKECEQMQRSFFVWFPHETSFCTDRVALYIEPASLSPISIVAERMKAKLNADRLLYQILCVFEWIWMINKSKYHVERRFSVRSFPRRLRIGIDNLTQKIRSYWIFMRSWAINWRIN